MENNRIRIPRISSVEDAVRLYYERPMLKNSDIMELFGCGLSKARQLRAYVEDRAREERLYINGYASVDVGYAYKVWGLNIDDLKKRLDYLLKYRKKVNA